MDTFHVDITRRPFVVLTFQLKPHELTALVGNPTNISEIRAAVKAKLIGFATGGCSL
jgi:hypothetical protein